jgi:hypothetical protein
MRGAVAQRDAQLLACDLRIPGQVGGLAAPVGVDMVFKAERMRVVQPVG